MSEESQEVNNPNCPHPDKPHRAYGLCVNCYNTVLYHFDEKKQRKVKDNVHKWYEKNKKRASDRNKQWRRNNPDACRRITCLSMLKSCLKRGIVKREEIIGVLNGD